MSRFNLRASSISDWLDCAYRAEAKYLLGMRGRPSGPAWLGTALHHGTAVFDQARIDQEPIKPADAAGEFVDKLHHPDEPVDWGDSSIKEAEHIGLRLTSRYCTELSPQYEFAAVEMSTEPLDIDIGPTTIRLTGTMDRTRVKLGKGGIGVSDLKSGKRAVDANGKATTTGHIWQIAIYEILAAHTTGEKITEPGEIIGMQTTRKARIGVGQIPNARAALLGAHGEKGVLEMLADDLEAGRFKPNPRSALCSERYCPRWNNCSYHA